MIGEIGVLIPIMGIGCGMLAIWTGHKQKMAKIAAQRGPALADELTVQFAEQTRELEDRVRVLERIVTDKGYDLASQIEALRDARKIEARLDASSDLASN
jgi:predicted ArsR family transcriptional regulator